MYLVAKPTPHQIVLAILEDTIPKHYKDQIFEEAAQDKEVIQPPTSI